MWVLLLVTFIISPNAEASFNGPLHLGFVVSFVIAAVFSLPGAFIGLVLERYGARRRPPLWIGLIAAAGVLYCLTSIAFTNRISRQPLFLIPIPPLMILTLLVFVPKPSLRQAFTWSIAVLSVFVGYYFLQGSTELMRDRSEALGILFGGALTSTLLWWVGFNSGQRSIKRQTNNSVHETAPSDDPTSVTPRRSYDRR